MLNRLLARALLPLLAGAALTPSQALAAGLVCADYGEFPYRPTRFTDRIPVSGPADLRTGNGLTLVGRGASGLDIYDDTVTSGNGFVTTHPVDAHSVVFVPSSSCVWVGGVNEIRLIDLSDPANPVVVRTESVPIGTVEKMELGVTALGFYRIFASGSAGASASVLVAANCTTGMLSVDFATDFTGPIVGLAQSGSTGVLASADSLFTVNLNVSPHTVVQRRAVSGANAAAMRSPSTVVITGSAGIETYSIDHAAPSALLGSDPSYSLAGAVYDPNFDIIYTTDPANDMFHAYDVSVPGSPNREWSLSEPIQSTGPLAVSGTNLTVGLHDGTTDRLARADVRNNQGVPVLHEDAQPFVPSAVDFLPGFGIAAVAGAGSTWVYSTANPAVPVLTNVFESPAATDVVLRQGSTGPILTVAGLADLRVIDLNTSNVAVLPGGMPEVDVSPDGTIAVVGDVFAGFSVVDISNPLNPVVVFSGSLLNAVNDVEFNDSDGTEVVVATSGTTFLYDVTNPAAPTVKATAPMTGIQVVTKGPNADDWLLTTGASSSTVIEYFFDTATFGGSYNEHNAIYDCIYGESLPPSGARSAGPPPVYITSTTGTVRVVDWPSLGTPTLIGEYTAPGWQPKGIASTGEVLLVADGSFPGGMRVLPGHAPAGATDSPVPAASGSTTMLGLSWPNPFAGATSVPLALGRRTELDLTVFDVTGRKVRNLAGGSYPAGRHVLRWDGRDGEGRPVGSGVYFVRLLTGEKVERAKVVLTR